MKIGWAFLFSLSLHGICLAWLSRPLALGHASGAQPARHLSVDFRKHGSVSPSSAHSEEQNKKIELANRPPATPSSPPPAASPPALDAPGVEFFWPARLLDVRPSPIEPIPDNPLGFEHFRTGGYAIVSLLIGADGRVVEATVEQTDLPQEAASRLRDLFFYRPFHPGIKNGRFVPARLRIEIVLAGIVTPAGSGDQDSSRGREN